MWNCWPGSRYTDDDADTYQIKHNRTPDPYNTKYAPRVRLVPARAFVHIWGDDADDSIDSFKVPNSRSTPHRLDDRGSRDFQQWVGAGLWAARVVDKSVSQLSAEANPELTLTLIYFVIQVSSWMADVNNRLTDRLIYIRQRFLKYRKKSHVKNHMFKSHKVKSFLYPIFYRRDVGLFITSRFYANRLV